MVAVDRRERVGKVDAGAASRRAPRADRGDHRTTGRRRSRPYRRNRDRRRSAPKPRCSACVCATTSCGACADPASVDVDAYLDRVGLRALADRETSTLSGGELQRLAIAAALAREPKFLISDESTAMVDAGGRGRSSSRSSAISPTTTAWVSSTSRTAPPKPRPPIGGSLSRRDALSTRPRACATRTRGRYAAPSRRSPSGRAPRRAAHHARPTSGTCIRAEHAMGEPRPLRHRLHDSRGRVDRRRRAQRLGQVDAGVDPGRPARSERRRRRPRREADRRSGRPGRALVPARPSAVAPPEVLEEVRAAGGVDDVRGAGRAAARGPRSRLVREAPRRRVERWPDAARRAGRGAGGATTQRSILDEPFAGLDAERARRARLVAHRSAPRSATSHWSSSRTTATFRPASSIASSSWRPGASPATIRSRTRTKTSCPGRSREPRPDLRPGFVRARPAPKPRRETELTFLRLVPGSSLVHRLWAGTKLLVAVELALMVSISPTWAMVGAAAAVVALESARRSDSARCVPPLAELVLHRAVDQRAASTCGRPTEPVVHVAGITLSIGGAQRVGACSPRSRSCSSRRGRSSGGPRPWARSRPPSPVSSGRCVGCDCRSTNGSSRSRSRSGASRSSSTRSVSSARPAGCAPTTSPRKPRARGRRSAACCSKPTT